MKRASIVLTIAVAMAPVVAQAQFSSGSTGADGPLNLTPPFAGCPSAPCTVAFTVPFNPTGSNPISGTNENVYNFTSINIASGVTLTMTGPNVRNRAVIWLATKNVTIAGNLVLDGQAAIAMGSNPGLNRAPAAPGPGGFPGGVGGYFSDGPQSGGGYGGGGPAVFSYPGGNGVYSFYNSQLTPLIGGTGGGGGNGGLAGGNGGAGGGAIRIVSSTSVSVTGSISAQGGSRGYPVPGNGSNGTDGGYGSGGAIHLIAPTLAGTGALYICGGGNNGVVQFNATTNMFSGPVNGCGTPPVYSYGLYNPPVPVGSPSVRITSIAGVAAPQYPTGSFSVPDVTINSSSSVTVKIAAQNIAVGTVVTLLVTSQSEPDGSFSCAPLAGTVQSSTASCTGVNFPSGVGITEVKASW